MFDTKIAIIVRDDLAVWQKLNVTAFLTSGLLGARAELLGEVYKDAAGNTYNPLLIQPIMVLTTDGPSLSKIHARALDRDAKLSIYIEEMFATGHDAANRAAVLRNDPQDMNIVGLALREEKKSVDKIIKGAKMHG